MTELPMLPMAPAAAPEPEPEPVLGEAAQRYKVEGMDCAACARTVEKAVAALDGATAARVSFGNATAGRGGTGAGRARGPGGRRRGLSRAAGVGSARGRAAAAVLALGARGALDHARGGDPGRGHGGEPRRRAAGGRRAAVRCRRWSAGGWFVARAALLALRRRSLDMNVLMALAAVGAVGIGALRRGRLGARALRRRDHARDVRARSQPPVGRGADGARAGAGARARRRRPSAWWTSRRSCPARASRSARASAWRSTASSTAAPRASTRRRSPASRSRVDKAPGDAGLRRLAQRATAR